MSRRPPPSRYPGRPTDMDWRMRRRLRRDNDASGRLQLLGLLVVLAVAALLTLHGLAQATSSANAQRTLRAVLPALTDLDQALAAHGDDIRALAGAGEPVPVPGIPIDVTIPAAVAGGGDMGQVRRAAVDAMAARVRGEGAAAFRAADGQQSAPGLFSRQWTVQRAVNLLRSGSHDRFVRLRTYAVLPALLLVVLLAWASGLRRAPVALGSAAVFAALLAVVIAVAGRAGAWVIGSGSGGVTAASVGRIARDLSMTPIAVAVTAGAGGVVLALAGSAVARWLPDVDSWGGRPRDARPRQWEEG